MKIRCLLFAEAKEIVGKNSVEFEFQESCDTDTLLTELTSRYPALKKIIGIFSFKNSFVLIFLFQKERGLEVKDSLFELRSNLSFEMSFGRTTDALQKKFLSH
jgi:molybdopterin converting factor small subunit